MERHLPIRDIYARVILDGKGYPALEVEVLAGEDTVGAASVPFGEQEGGRCAERAADEINCHIAQELIGKNVFAQEETDRELLRLSEISDSQTCVRQVTLAVSAAAARAAAAAGKMPLYRYLGGTQADRMPVPVTDIMSSGCPERGKESGRIVLIPIAGERFWDRLDLCSRVFHSLGKLLCGRGGSAGEFSVSEKEIKDAPQMVRRAAEQAGICAGRDIMIALCTCVQEETGCCGNAIYEFPVCPEKAPCATGSAARIDVSGAGTLTGIFEAVKEAKKSGNVLEIWQSAMGTGDTLAADVAVACGADWIRAGGLMRLEHTMVYDRLLKIDESMRSGY